MLKPIVFAFDLDGTLCKCGGKVSKKVADVINGLGTVYVITGGPSEKAKRQTKLLKNKIIFGMRDYEGNSHLDLSKIMDVSKETFIKSNYCQSVRRKLCIALNKCVASFIGGRSTIDIMKEITKGSIVKDIEGRVIYFYDCSKLRDKNIINDAPAIKMAWKSVKTSPERIIRDIQRVKKSL